MDDLERGTDRTYLISGADFTGESIGPAFTTATDAHRIARRAIAGVGGTVRILRDGVRGWTEVARYTDTGRYPVDSLTLTSLGLSAPPATPRRARSKLRRQWVVLNGPTSGLGGCR